MSRPHRETVEESVLAAVASAEDELIELCSRLVQIPAPMPPGDTTEIAQVVRDYLYDRGVVCETYEPQPGKCSVVAAIGGTDGAPTLVVNAHLDTFKPAEGSWSHGSPYSGAVENGRIYGAGASDMRAGVAAAAVLAGLLAPHSSQFQRRVVFTFVGDEEAGGKWGTDWLLENVPAVGSARAALIGDQCGIDVIGIAEKGVCFFKVMAEGASSHAAYGSEQSAIHRLLQALNILVSMATPPEDDAELVEQVTVNVGKVEGGVARNLVAASAEADVSIRVPIGRSTRELMTKALDEIHDLVPNVSVEIERISEPSQTPEGSPIVKAVRDASTRVLNKTSRPTTRLGASDARLFRERDIPTVVFGPAAQNMGALDEFVLIGELLAVAQVHTSVALDFLLGGENDPF